MSATTSSYTSQCVHDFVPADADLVLVEFSVNDWEVGDAASTWMNNNQRCAGRARLCAWCSCRAATGHAQRFTALRKQTSSHGRVARHYPIRTD